MGVTLKALPAVYLLLMLGSAPISIYGVSAMTENFNPVIQMDRPAPNNTTSANSVDDSIRPTGKRNSDPLRYAVALTAFVFVSLVLLFIFLTRRKRRREE